MKKKLPKIGGHVSAAGGLHKAFENAVSIGAENFQIHATSPRQWKVRMPDTDAVDLFLKQREATGITRYYIHAPYLINLATPDPDLLEKSYQNLKGNFEIGQLIGARGVVFHLGSSKGWGLQEGIEQQVQVVQRLLNEVPDNGCMLLLENSAGGGDKIGATIDQLGLLMRGISNPRVGICFDTAHAFESGVLEYTPAKIKIFFDEFDQNIGIEKIGCLHINDSKTAFNSQHDRHENIGEGEIGIEGFRAFAQEDRLHDVDWCLETPGFDNTGPDAKNIEILKNCFHADI